MIFQLYSLSSGPQSEHSQHHHHHRQNPHQRAEHPEIHKIPTNKNYQTRTVNVKFNRHCIWTGQEIAPEIHTRTHRELSNSYKYNL